MMDTKTDARVEFESEPEPLGVAPFFSEVSDVLWSITDKCNLDCVYCRAIPHDGTCAAEPTDEQINHILNELGKLPRLSSLIISGGEALLSRHLQKVLVAAKSLAQQVFLITNGTTLKSDKQRAILKQHKPLVMCTVDSTDDSINSITRGQKVLGKSLKTIDWLLQNDFFVVAIVVLTKHNYPSLRATCEELYGRGVNNILIQQLHCPDAASREFFIENSPTPKQISELSAMLEQVRKTCSEIQIDDNEICFFNTRSAFKEKLCNPEKQYWPQRLLRCGAGRKFFAIKTNGDIVPCNAFLDSVAGNLHCNSIKEIFESSTVMVGLRQIANHRVDVVPGCNTCHLNSVCDGGCRADALNLTGEIASRHPLCPAVIDDGHVSLKCAKSS